MYGIIAMNHSNAKNIDLILQLNKLSPEMFRHRGREVDFFPTIKIKKVMQIMYIVNIPNSIHYYNHVTTNKGL